MDKAVNTLAAVGYLSAAERRLELLVFHENIHDQLHALRMQPQFTVLNQILLPGEICPFCERHINEHPGPILGVDDADLRVPSDPERNHHIFVSTEATKSREAMMPINDPELAASIFVSGDEPREILDANHGIPRAHEPLLTIGNDERRARSLWHSVHHELHNIPATAIGEAFMDFVVATVGPHEECPLCQRALNEEPGPIIDEDGIINRGKWPTPCSDQGREPLIKNLVGHQGEHGSSSNEVAHDPEP